MRSMLFVALSAIATLVAARENPFNIPTQGYEFTAGEPTTLNWTPTTEGTVTLKLQWGSAFTSSSGTTIVSNIANSGSYTWSVPSDITDHSDYTVEIISDTDDSTNYLPRFTIEGAEVATSTTTSTTTTETTTTEETTTTTETSSTSTRTTLTTTTTTTSESTSSPTPTSTSSETPVSTTTDSSSTSTESTESPSDSPTSVPSVNGEDGDNAGMSNRVSGGLLALALGVAALV